MKPELDAFLKSCNDSLTGETVTVTVTPEQNKFLEKLTVSYMLAAQLEVTYDKNLSDNAIKELDKVWDRRINVNSSNSKNLIRKFITREQFESLGDFNNMYLVAEDIMNLSGDEYWFQVTFEVTKDCDRHGYAVLEAHKR